MKYYWAAILFTLTLFPSSGFSIDDSLPNDGSCAVIVSSFKTQSGATRYIHNELVGNPSAEVHQSSNGWFGVSVRRLPAKSITQSLAQLKASQSIPSDSFAICNAALNDVDFTSNTSVLPVANEAPDWRQVLWTWADEMQVSNDSLPRTEKGLDDLIYLRLQHGHQGFGITLIDETIKKPVMTYLPTEIGKLKNVRQLWAGNNDLIHIPQEISQLEALYDISLVNNNLDDLPIELKALQNMSSISLSGNDFKEIPAVIFQWSSLSGLTINQNHITEISEEIRALKELTWLHVKDNSLTGVPEEVFKLPKLEEIELDNNFITALSIPEGIENSRIRQISAANNRLKKLPEQIEGLSRLSQLNLKNNNLSEMPESIAKLERLKYLDLENNSFEEIAKPLVSLSLQGLNLRDNRIEYIAEDISNMQELYELDLANNQLQKLPEAFSKLAELRELNLSGNNFDTFPKQLSGLSNLERLQLDDFTQQTSTLSINGLENLQMVRFWLDDEPIHIHRLHEIHQSIFADSKYRKANEQKKTSSHCVEINQSLDSVLYRTLLSVYQELPEDSYVRKFNDMDYPRENVFLLDADDLVELSGRYIEASKSIDYIFGGPDERHDIIYDAIDNPVKEAAIAQATAVTFTPYLIILTGCELL